MPVNILRSNLYQFHRTLSLVNHSDHIDTPCQETDIYSRYLIIQFPGSNFFAGKVCYIIPGTDYDFISFKCYRKTRWIREY